VPRNESLLSENNVSRAVGLHQNFSLQLVYTVFNRSSKMSLLLIYINN